MRVVSFLAVAVIAISCKAADAPIELRPVPPPPSAAERPPPPEDAAAARVEVVAEPSDGTDRAVDAGPFVSQCAGVSLVMVSAKPDKYAVDVVLELRNDGASPVSLMTTGDGSSHDMRNPTVAFELTPDRRAVEARCGNVNDLSAEDFVTLAPGARHKLGWVRGPRPAKPGRYTLRATFENDPSGNLIRGVASPPDKALVARARATAPCRLTSNTLAFDWK